MFIIITELCSERRSDKFRRMKGKENWEGRREDRREEGRDLECCLSWYFSVCSSLYSISAKLKVTDKEGFGADHCRALKTHQLRVC